MTHHTPTTLPAKRSRASAGFLLNELLISLGIFAIGMTALASLFPVAALLQRETNDEVLSEAAAQSAKAVVEAKTLTYTWTGAAGSGDLANYHSNAGASESEVVPLLRLSAALANRFPETDRALPSAQIYDNGAATPTYFVDDCDIYWIPFIQDVNGDPAGPNWVMRIFVCNKDSRANYSDTSTNVANPGVSSDFPRVLSLNVTAVTDFTFTFDANHFMEPGDVLMDSNGIDYIVAEDVSNKSVRVLNKIAVKPSAPAKVWYAPPYGGGFGPGQRVVTVKLDVQPAN